MTKSSILVATAPVLALISAEPASALARDYAASALNTSDATAASSVLASLDPNTIASKIVNDPSAPEVRGAKGKLFDDPKVTGGKGLRIEVPRKGQNAWDVSVNSALKKPVKAGDTLLLVFAARLANGENGATTTTLPWNSVSLTSPPWSGVVGGPADIGPDWKMIEIKGKADKNYAPGQLAAGVQLATAKQTVDLGPLIVLDLGPGQ